MDDLVFSFHLKIFDKTKNLIEHFPFLSFQMTKQQVKRTRPFHYSDDQLFRRRLFIFNELNDPRSIALIDSSSRPSMRIVSIWFFFRQQSEAELQIGLSAFQQSFTRKNSHRDNGPFKSTTNSSIINVNNRFSFENKETFLLDQFDQKLNIFAFVSSCSNDIFIKN